MTSRNSSALCAIALLFIWSGDEGVAAESGPPPHPGDSGSAVDSTKAGQLEEIVVTAEKRASTVQKTPISMTAMTGDDLQNVGLTSAQSIAEMVPGVSVASNGPGQAQYEMRGLSADGGQAPTVGFYIDEIPISPPAEATIGKSAIDPDLYDLARVEVLRGPQGTLYGAGSMGGTVKLVTSAPDLSGFSGTSQTIGSGTSGGGLNYGEKAMVNLPMIEDKVALRLVGTYSHTSGWIDRVVVPNFPLETDSSGTYGTTRGVVSSVPGSKVYKGVNDENLTSARASILIKPTDALTITPSVFYQQITQSGMNTYDSIPGNLAHYQPYDVAEPFSDRFTLFSLTANYSFADFSITSATGYWTRQSMQTQDATEVTEVVLQLPAFSPAGGLGIGPARATEIDQTHQFSQELRAASLGNGPFQWIIGGFFSQYQFKLKLSELAPGILSLTGSTLPTDNVFNIDQPMPVRQTAIFGNVSYNVTERLKATVGARQFDYHSSTSSTASGIASQSGTSVPILESGRASASGLNPMATVSYTLPQTMFYVTAAKGFRVGGANFPVPTTGAFGSGCLQNLQALGLTSSPLLFDPDTVWSYELGEKAQLFDHRITLNADVYLTRWSKVQEPVALACGIGFTTNASEAQVKGSELELRAALTDDLVLTQNIGYSKANFTQSSPEANIVAGQSLLNVPKWTVATILRFEHPISQGLAITGSLTNSYVSSSEDLSYSLNTLPARDLTGLRAGIQANKWSAELFADNLLNHHYALEYINLLSFTGPPYNRITSNQPLTIGVNLNLKF
jgi:iron complex outermembrane receptor protein